MFLLAAVAGRAQQNATGTGQQTVQLALSHALDITFTNNNNNIGNTVNLIFDDINDYTNGVESSDQQLRVRSNAEFDVRVEVASEHFTYTGNASSNNSMDVDEVLKMKVTENNTGGTITGGFQNYKKLTDNDKKMINKGEPGNDQTFSVRYKATPGFGYAAGTYAVDVIYTLTEH
jgi:hypothetical protein